MKYTHTPQKGKFGHCTMAQVWDEKGNSICYINSTELEADATQTARQFSKTPEMIEALKWAYAVLSRVDHSYVERNTPEGQMKLSNMRFILKELES